MDGFVADHLGETLGSDLVVLRQDNFAGGGGNNRFEVVLAVFSGDLPQVLADEEVRHFLSAADRRTVNNRFQFGHGGKLVHNKQAGVGSHNAV